MIGFTDPHPATAPLLLQLSTISGCLTFDCQLHLVGDSLPLRVEDVAGVAARVGLAHPLHHQALVADDDAAPDLVRQQLALHCGGRVQQAVNHWAANTRLDQQIITTVTASSYKQSFLEKK